MDFIEKQNNLPSDVRSFFDSDEPRLELEKACFLYGAKDEDIDKISGQIGLMFVGDMKISSLPDIILQNIFPSKDMALGLSYEITKRIFNRFPEHFKDASGLLSQWERAKSAPVISEKEAEEKVQAVEQGPASTPQEINRIPVAPKQNLVALTLLDALKNYPEIGEQAVTSARINLRNYPEPVRPSVKNWLTDYTAALGYESHSIVERTNYLFHTKNTEILSHEDRTRLSYILKAFDERATVNVNAATKQIVFPSILPETGRETIPSKAPTRPAFQPAQPIIQPSRPQTRENMTRISATPRPSVRPAETPRPQMPEIRPAGDINLKKNVFNSASQEAFGLNQISRNNLPKPEKTQPFSARPSAPVNERSISPSRPNIFEPKPSISRPSYQPASPKPIPQPVQPKPIQPQTRPQFQEDRLSIQKPSPEPMRPAAKPLPSRIPNSSTAGFSAQKNIISLPPKPSMPLRTPQNPPIIPKSPENNIKFSSPQKLPVEKIREVSSTPPIPVQSQRPISPKEPKTTQIQPTVPQPTKPQSPKPAPRIQPLIISPASVDIEEENSIPSNVVNLKDM